MANDHGPAQFSCRCVAESPLLYDRFVAVRLMRSGDFGIGSGGREKAKRAA